MKTDNQLQQDVQSELQWDPSIDHTEIGVSVIDGVVTLNGCVKSYAEKLAAERAARRVTGVTAIAQELKVRLKSDPKTADHEIAKRIMDVLHWNVMVPQEDIAIKVENGWVTLSGNVTWHYQSEEASRLASGINGVVGVTSNLLVSRRPTGSDLQRRIKDALGRQADIDAASLHVVVDGGKVTLSGKVRASYERRIAEQAVWSAPGVVQVVDRIALS